MTEKSATREQALRIAQRLGCYGAHQDSDGNWMPCADHETWVAVRSGKEIPKKKVAQDSVIEHRAKIIASKSRQLFSTRDEALRQSRKNGCSKVRIVIVNGTQMFAACMPKANGRPENTGMIPPSADFEQLGQSGIQGIDTLPNGGLVSGKTDDIEQIDAKGFVNLVSRSTDPDVFTDPDSARVRSRQLGCIGIRSYTARDGKTVYLPCTNSPDYNRAMGLRTDGKPKKKDELHSDDEKSLAKTPAPKKDRIIGSDKNRVGSAGSISSAGTIDLNDTIRESLVSKVREHNADVKKKNKENWSKTNLRSLMAVYRRGAGAFSVSHRPGMTRNQWAMGRVNAFLNLLMTGSAKASYVTDNDLLPKGHPWKKKTIGSKSLYIDGTEYLAEFFKSGFSYRRKEPAKVNRYIMFALDQEVEQIS